MDFVPRVPPFDRPATYDDLVKLPDHLVAEIVNGELHASPRPALRHAQAGSAVGQVLLPAFRHPGPGGWWLLYEPELQVATGSTRRGQEEAEVRDVQPLPRADEYR